MLVKEVRALIADKDDNDVFQVTIQELPARFNVSIDVIKPAVEGGTTVDAPEAMPEGENASEGTTEAVEEPKLSAE